ncbi:MAG: hypothetical protein COB93_11455 [Sneathiella sp.]|nr:MAG: hypothetical protein COB93_11455 [Sneathiella sp.]
MKLLSEETDRRSSGVSRIYDRVAEYADHHAKTEHTLKATDIPVTEEQKKSLESAVQGSKNSPTEDRPLFLKEEESSDTQEFDNEIEVFALTELTDAEDIDPIFETPAPVRQKKPIASGLHQAGKSNFSMTKAATAALSKPKKAEPLSDAKYGQIAKEVSQLKKDNLGRIRISVRMAPKDHLQLKLIAAHTQMSAQAIFETALEEYVSNHGTELLPESCSCVLDKTTL